MEKIFVKELDAHIPFVGIWSPYPPLPSACISRLYLLHREKKDKERRWAYRRCGGEKGIGANKEDSHILP
jgi:hypothetical protein